MRQKDKKKKRKKESRQALIEENYRFQGRESHCRYEQHIQSAARLHAIPEIRYTY